MDRLYVIVGSDFGRTPWYNGQNGKDHWSITSMMLRGPTIRGGRVLGATDGGQRALRIDPATLAISSGNDAVRLTPGIVHMALRHTVGVAQHEAASRFAVHQPVLPLFA